MITQKKLKVYNDFRGDVDAWVRTGTKKEKAIMTDGDWALIDSFLQDILLVKQGFASEVFKNTLQRKLIESCDDSETIRHLKMTAWEK